jgi:hypothetical protein
MYFCLTGFVCPIENSIQYFCCGTDNNRYCCSPDRYSFETKFSIDYSQTYYNILTDEIGTTLINHRKLTTKQFEQFQRYFLPIFLLTTTVFFVVGIALWFWLYKHKTFYSLGQDDFIESRTLRRTQSDSIPRTRETNNRTLNQQSRLFLHPSTAV